MAHECHRLSIPFSLGARALAFAFASCSAAGADDGIHARTAQDAGNDGTAAPSTCPAAAGFGGIDPTTASFGPTGYMGPADALHRA